MAALFLPIVFQRNNNANDVWFLWFMQILDTPSLLAEGSKGLKKNIFKQKPPEADASASGCCWSWCADSLRYSSHISRSLTEVFSLVIPLLLLKQAIIYLIFVGHELAITCNIAMLLFVLPFFTSTLLRTLNSAWLSHLSPERITDLAVKFGVYLLCNLYC